MLRQSFTPRRLRRPASPASLVGRWERTLLRTADGRLDTQADVVWLQAFSLFVDLRLGHGRPAEGFAGVLRHAGGVFEWRHEIDLAPDAGPDAGTLEWDGDVLVERGAHDPYLERWRRSPDHDEPCWGMRLADRGGWRHAILLRVGDDIGWATAGLGTAEVSLGRVAGDEAVFTRSSLASRVGSRLDWSFHTRTATVTIAGADVRWRITDREGIAA